MHLHHYLNSPHWHAACGSRGPVAGQPWRRAAVLTTLLLATAAPALGQSATRPGPSPLAPNSTGAPIFDTTKPSYDESDASPRAGQTIVAEVEGRAITLAEVADRIRAMPLNIANLPFEVLFPNMVEHLIRREALILRAHREGLDEDPAIKRRVTAAADEVLANETVAHAVSKTITEAALQERYRRDYAGKPGPEEVHVQIMLTMTEPEAAALIARLRAGEDFATLAKAASRDSSASVGGDLGFLPRDGLNPEVGAVAFALPPGQVAVYPVRGAAGWFVVKTAARRAQPTQPFAVVRPAIRQALLREGAYAVIRAALNDVVVHEYSLAGKDGGAGTESRP